MKRGTFIFFILLFFLCQSAFAKQNVWFLTKQDKEVSTRDSAYSIRIISMPDSGTQLFNIKEYYKNGKPKLVGKSIRAEYPLMQGQCITYFPSGRRESIGTYKDGYLDGIIYNFFPNGKLYIEKKYEAKTKITEGSPFKPEYIILTSNDSTGKPMVVNGNGHYIGYDEDFKFREEGELKDGKRDGEWKGENEIGDIADTTITEPFTFVEKYNNGTLLIGESTARDGTKAQYTNRADEPVFKGGVDNFARFLSNNIVYPEAARRNDITGRVYLTFIVEKDGTITNITVFRNPNDELTAEAVRVMKRSPKWVPGKYYGRTARVKYKIPIKFNLAD